MNYYMQAFLLTFIEALCCTVFFNTFCERKYAKRSWKNMGLFVMMFVGFIGIAFIPYQMYFIKALICIGLIGCVMGWKYEADKLQCFFLAAIYYVLLILIDRVVLVFLEQNGIKMDNTLNPVRATLCALLCKNTLVFVIFLLNKRYKTVGKLSVIHGNEWLKLLIFPIVSNVCMAVFAMSNNPNGREALLVAFSFLFLNLLLFDMIEDIIKKEEEKRENQQFRERAKTQFEMYKYMADSYTEQRKQFHDVHNHLLCLQGLLSSGKYDEAGKYLNQYRGNLVEEADYINTNHAVINSILNQKYKMAKQQGIAIVLAVNDLHDIDVLDEDIVVILSNILDNAIEACQNQTGVSKIIRLKCWKEKDRLLISCQNPVNKDRVLENGSYVTTKQDKEKHGIGLKNVKSAVEKYQGEDICCCFNGYFTHSIIIRKG